MPATGRATGTGPVVCGVGPTSAARFTPEPGTGQPGWRSTLAVAIHPRPEARNANGPQKPELGEHGFRAAPGGLAANRRPYFTSPVKITGG
jgi:hypothetical protein